MGARKEFIIEVTSGKSTQGTSAALFSSGVQKQEQGCEGCCCHFEGPSAEL